MEVQGVLEATILMRMTEAGMEGVLTRTATIEVEVGPIPTLRGPIRALEGTPTRRLLVIHTVEEEEEEAVGMDRSLTQRLRHLG